MKILMLTPYLPYPPSSGGQIRSYNLIKQLSQIHEITLCSLIKYEDERKYVKNLEPYCKQVLLFKRAEKPFTLQNILNTGFSLYPFVVIRNFSTAEKKAIDLLIQKEQFDLIHAETFYVCPHIPKTDIPIVLVDQTIEFDVYLHYVQNYKFPPLKPLLYLDVLKTKYWEGYYWKKASRVVAVSDKDATVMRKIVPGLKVEVVPNGVGEDLIEEVPLHYDQTILLMGNYLWLQNAQSAKILASKVFPLVKKQLPEVKLIIAGQNTHKVSEIQGEGIELRDFPVDDIKSVQQVYRSSGVMVAPIYGPGGTRLKILGAMSSKLPVVTTPIGNEGIDAIPNESILLGKTPEEIAEQTVKILTDQKLYKRVATNARKMVLENYSYQSIAKKLSQVYQEVADAKS